MNIQIITGQTATGKTNAAIKTALEIGGELVNFDSRQSYTHLDIITGKDFTDKNFVLQKVLDNFSIGYYTLSHPKGKVKVWLYDIVDPKQYFSSFDYASCATSVIKDIMKRGKTPVLVGGTYLYMYHLLYCVDTQKIPPDFKLRKRLASVNTPTLHKELNAIDSNILSQLNESDSQNPQRLIRKIEIASYYKREGKEVPLKMTYQVNDSFLKANVQIKGIAYKDKTMLADAITKRVEKRLENGAIKETEALLKNGYKESDCGMQTIGYKQIISYLKGEKTKDQAIQEWITAEVQYAKRQLTFMKKDPNIRWTHIPSLTSPS